MEVYLDNASTAKYSNFDDIIVDTITTAMRDSWMNPSSLYASNIKQKIDKCRSNVAKFIGAKPEEVYYTSGGSESNCMAIEGFVKQCVYDGVKPVLITSFIEHKSIIDCVESLNDLGYAETYMVDVDEYGYVNLSELDYRLKKVTKEGKKVLVSIQYANNEIGTIQKIDEIADIVHKYNGIFHTDAVQCVGQIPIDLERFCSGVDMLSASGHKISPVLKGVGFLYVKNGVNIKPIIYGSQELGLRGGTENTFGIIGLNKAIELLGVDLGHDDDGNDILLEKYTKLYRKRNYLMNKLVNKFSCQVNGDWDLEHRLPNNINVAFPQGIMAETLLYVLDMSGIKVSVGSACNSRSIEPSHVLKAIGLSDEDAMKSIRFTVSEDVTYEEIEYVIDEIDKAIKLINL